MEQSLNRIADVMQCPLSWEKGVLTGSVKNLYSPLPGLDIPVLLEAKKLSHCEQTSVLFKVIGHLWVLVGFYQKTNSLTLFLIDATKVEVDGTMITPDKLMSKVSTLKETVDAVRPAIVKSFLWRDTHWEKIVLPK